MPSEGQTRRVVVVEVAADQHDRDRWYTARIYEEMCVMLDDQEDDDDDSKWIRGPRALASSPGYREFGRAQGWGTGWLALFRELERDRVEHITADPGLRVAPVSPGGKLPGQSWAPHDECSVAKETIQDLGMVPLWSVTRSAEPAGQERITLYRHEATRSSVLFHDHHQGWDCYTQVSFSHAVDTTMEALRVVYR